LNNLKIVLRILFTIILFIVADLLIFNTLFAGMQKYYGLNKKSKILCVGHSHTVLGIDSEKMEKKLNVPVSKYAIAGANTMDRYYMIKHYLSINPDVETIIYDVDTRLFDSEGLSSASYSLFFPFIKNLEMREYLKSQASSEEFFVSQYIKTARFRDQTLNISLRGLLNKIESKKTTKINLNNYKQSLEGESKNRVKINSYSIDYLNKTIEYLLSKEKRIILVNLPVIDLLNKIDVGNQKKAKEIFQSMSKKKNVYFFDYADEYDNKHELFFDLRHLNEQGKQLITDRLIKDLKAING
jgi:hypothetical protein